MSTTPGAVRALTALKLLIALLALMLIARGVAVMASGVYESASKTSGPYTLTGARAHLAGLVHVGLGAFIGAAGLSEWTARKMVWRVIAGMALATALVALAAGVIVAG